MELSDFIHMKIEPNSDSMSFCYTFRNWKLLYDQIRH